MGFVVKKVTFLWCAADQMVLKEWFLVSAVSTKGREAVKVIVGFDPLLSDSVGWVCDALCTV